MPEFKVQNIVFLNLNNHEPDYAIITTCPKKRLIEIFNEHITTDEPEELKQFYPRVFQEMVLEAGFTFRYITFPILNYAEFDRHDIR